MRLLRDMVAVIQDEFQDVALISDLIVAQTKRGIIDSQSQLSRTGTVAYIGPGKESPKSGYIFPMQVAPGDRVTFGEFDFPTVDENGQRYVLIQEADITGILYQDAATAA